MNLLRALAVMAIALGLEAILGRLAPVLHGWVDLMMIPVAWYAISGSQRSAMLVGCAGGLLQDAWFQAGVFGISGFKKTLLGWAVGGLCSRLDLNHREEIGFRKNSLELKRWGWRKMRKGSQAGRNRKGISNRCRIMRSPLYNKYANHAVTGDVLKLPSTAELIHPVNGGLSKAA